MNTRSGLSILELLIGLAVLALIAGGLSGAMGLGARVWDHSRGLSNLEEPLILRQRLRSWLSQANPPSHLTVFPSEFSGTLQNLHFVTFAQTPFAPEAAALKVHVELRETTLELRLEYLDDEGLVLKTDTRQLAQNVTDVRMSYFDAKERDAGWKDEWDDRPRLPDLIRIEVGEGSNPDWPEMIVVPILR